MSTSDADQDTKFSTRLRSTRCRLPADTGPERIAESKWLSIVNVEVVYSALSN